MNNNIRQPYTFDRVVRIVITLIIIFVILYFLNLLKGVLLPFLVACLIAYILEPLVQFNKRILKSKTRILPITFTLIEVGGVLALLGYIFIPHLIEEAAQMTVLMRKYATTQTQIPFVPEDIHTFIRENVDFEMLTSLLSREEWIALARNTLASSWDIVSSSIAVLLEVISWAIVLLYIIFIMLDYERLNVGFKRLIPKQYRKNAFRIFNDVKEAMNQYFRGQFIIASIVGVLFATGFIIIGLPLGLILGLFIGLLNMVPYLQVVSFPITALLCMVYSVDSGINFWVITAESVAVYVIVQIIQDMFLVPKIMGKAMGLNPAIILLSLSIWGSLLGFMGLIVALPLTTLVLSYYDKYVVNRPIDRLNRMDKYRQADKPTDREE